MEKKLIVGFIGVILAIVAGAFLISRGGEGKPSAPAPTLNPKASIDPNTLPGINTGPEPWPAELSRLKDRLTAIGLPALTSEGTTLHTHQHLGIFINGNQIAIPADIGVDDPAKFIAPIHTHDATAVIHIESPVVQTFTLGQFFDIWGVRFTQDCIGGYCAGNGRTLQVFSNGQLVTGNFRDLALTERQEIVIVFGDTTTLPSPIPSTFNFPSNL